MTKAKRSVPHDVHLHKQLRNRDFAAAYLAECLACDDSQATFLLGLRDVAAAFGVKEIAEMTDLSRENLYKALSKTGNPRLVTLLSLLKAVGIRMTFEAEPKRARRSA